MTSTLYARIYALVKAVPMGKVATYGQIAKLAGCSARQVGFAMSAAPEDIPWQRIINSRGEISMRADGAVDMEQSLRLKTEGVAFNGKGRTDLSIYQWQGPDAQWWAEQNFEPPLRF